MNILVQVAEEHPLNPCPLNSTCSWSMSSDSMGFCFGLGHFGTTASHCGDLSRIEEHVGKARERRNSARAICVLQQRMPRNRGQLGTAELGTCSPESLSKLSRGWGCV